MEEVQDVCIVDWVLKHVAALGVVGRLNQSQLNEHSCNELAATAVRMMKQVDNPEDKMKIVYKLLKYLNPDEAKDLDNA